MVPLSAQDDVAKSKSNTIAGEWKFKSGQRGSELVAEDRFPASITFSDDVITLPAAPEIVFKIRYRIDWDKSPAEIDLEIIEGPAENAKAQGIIKLEQDSLTICYDPTGASRPREFAGNDDNWYFVFVLTRNPQPFDPANMVGVWEIISGRQAGEEMEDSRLQGRVEFTRDAIRIPPGNEASFLMSYKLDTKVYPATIDIELVEGPQPGAIAHGIIKLDNGNLVLCYDFMGQGRPKEFKSTAENSFFLFELKRV
ncbi:MAG TPA: TIGR03067 domain-containing protein, partial [Pirellulaceae bacterium]|nr:TIGR03067 domain-containing protein [Pirellulaceae bacterium]